MFTYDPPAKIDDLANRPTRAAFLTDWHHWISGLVHDEISKLRTRKEDRVPHPLFFSEVESPAQNTDLPVTWNAFPLSIARITAADPVKGWAYLDGLDDNDEYTVDPKRPVIVKQRRQDEYCEWRREDNGPRGPRYIFTAEGPEYWVKLAEHDMGRVVELYQQHVSPQVREADLLLKQDILFDGVTVLAAGTYDPYNVWNTEKGLMHLTQRNNTLGAEINLAARATVLRRDMHGQRIVDSRRLIASSGYGSSNRSSDPNIGFGVNITAVPAGATSPLSITLANPVGLYMDDIAPNRLTDDQDRPLVGWFEFVRGARGHGLMAVLQPPEGDNRTLADVYVDGVPLQSGAQVASLIQMVVYAATADLGMPMSPLRPPALRACVPAGTDLTNLDAVNVDANCPAAQTCEYYGHHLKPPRVPTDYIEAYPEIFAAGAPEALFVHGLPGRSRNG